MSLRSELLTVRLASSFTQRFMVEYSKTEVTRQQEPSSIPFSVDFIRQKIFFSIILTNMRTIRIIVLYFIKNFIFQ